MKHRAKPTSMVDRIEQDLEQVEGFLRRLRLTWLLRRFPPRLVWAGFVCANCFVAMAILSAVAMISHTGFVFPSLGPTAYLLFFTPRSPASSPKHAICGHLIGLLFGWAALWATGLLHAPSVVSEGVNTMRILAAALSLGATGAAMVLLNVGHPPAGATTLIVALGFVTSVRALWVIELAVIALVLYAMLINRISGVDYPLWSPRRYKKTLPRPPLI